jgi:hypothetical protein
MRGRVRRERSDQESRCTVRIAEALLGTARSGELLCLWPKGLDPSDGAADSDEPLLCFLTSSLSLPETANRILSDLPMPTHLCFPNRSPSPFDNNIAWPFVHRRYQVRTETLLVDFSLLERGLATPQLEGRFSYTLIGGKVVRRLHRRGFKRRRSSEIWSVQD